MLAVNEKVPILSGTATHRGEDYLSRIASLLATTQHSDGAWRVDWSVGEQCHPPASAPSSWGASIHVTGHHLEWLAIAPRRLLPVNSIQQAIDFLTRGLQTVTSREILGSYCPWSHAVRSLLLWQIVLRSSNNTEGHHGA